MEIRVGNVCRCRQKRLGVVYLIKDEEYIGIGFDGRPWISKVPELIASDIFDYVVKQYEEGYSEGRNFALKEIYG